MVSQVFVGLPDELSRAAMVQFYLRDLDHTAMTEPGWLKVTGMTDGWSGSEIEVGEQIISAQYVL